MRNRMFVFLNVCFLKYGWHYDKNCNAAVNDIDKDIMD